MRGVGIEPTQVSPYAPQAYASASSATLARISLVKISETSEMFRKKINGFLQERVG